MCVKLVFDLYLPASHFQNMEEFEKDLKVMRESYFELERRFIEISRIIPLDNPPETYSPRLYDILQTSCGQVENLFRLICNKLNLELRIKPRFMDYYNTLNETKILEIQHADYLSANKVFLPFNLVEKKIPPFWWLAYNETKHKLPAGYKQGNLTNTMNALSGVYLLQCLATYSLHWDSKILEYDEWMDERSISINTLIPTIEAHWNLEDVRPKSAIFFPLSYFRPAGGL
jgi:hypothetical protein